MELLGIASIGPFMALVADPKLIEPNAILAYLEELSGYLKQVVTQFGKS